VVWLVAIASLGMMFLTSCIFFSFFVFFKPVQAEFGWTAMELSIAFLISLLIICVLLVVTRRLEDRFSVRLAVTLVPYSQVQDAC
jgi:hypothetical protein